MKRLTSLLALTAFLVVVAVPAIAYASGEPPAPVRASAVASDPAMTRLEDDDLRVRFSGAWKTAWFRSVSGQTYRIGYSSTAAAAASFEGTGVAFISNVGPARGKARVYIDGSFAATVDLYAPVNGGSRSVWATDTLAPGRHTIKVMPTGTRSPASSATYVVVDAFDVPATSATPVVPGTLVNNGSSKLVRLGSWYTSTRTTAFGGSSLRTGAKGASVTVRFKGTGVTWLGRKDSSSGMTEVLLDGKRVATVSQYRTAVSEKRVAYSVTGLKYDVHNLTIRSLGAPSTTGGGNKVDFDAFAVNGTLLQAYRPTPFAYPWATYIVVDKSSFKLYWVRNGMLIKTYPIAHGKPGSPTPSRVWRIDAKYMTDPSSVYGPRKMRLFKQVRTASGYRYEYTRYLIHGTNQPWVIGTQASLGCIRMYNRDVLELWPQVPLGTMVVTRD